MHFYDLHIRFYTSLRLNAANKHQKIKKEKGKKHKTYKKIKIKLK